MRFLDSLENFLTNEVETQPGDGIIVAYSGGADSTALLWGLKRLQSKMKSRLVAAHLDHALDEGSATRAAQAAARAEELAVPFHHSRRTTPMLTAGGLGLEAEAREGRYRFLEELRERLGFQWIATAHHRDDQAETVLLRMRFGSGPFGLGGIQRRRGAVIRPLLDESRAALRQALRTNGLKWTEDPTNADLRRPRNRIRHRVLGPSGGHADALQRSLGRIAIRATGARHATDRTFEMVLEPKQRDEGLSVEKKSLLQLPPGLLGYALSYLHRRAEIPYPPSKAAVSELARQLANDRGIGCDCGESWRWEGRQKQVILCRTTPETPLFTYTLKLPGELEVEELSLFFRMRLSSVHPWMFSTSPRRAALALPLGTGERVTIRNRRPGDRLRPFGWNRSCRLKDLLINRQVPRPHRSRLPLLCCGDEIAWVPGVTINERYRIASEREVWVAEIVDPEALR